MSFSPDICIRGAGIVGRSLALLLAREKLRVALVDAPPTAATPDVRVYSLNGAAKRLLEDLGCWPEHPAVTPVHRMQICGDGHGQLSFNAVGHPMAELNWMVDVPELEKRLAAAVPLHTLIDVVAAPVDAPLTVVCEGRASQTRTQLGVRFDTTPYEQHAVAARLQCAQAHGGVARQWFRFDKVPGMALPQAEVLALLPMGGEGGREVGLVWSVHPARAHALMALEPIAFAQALEAACSSALGPMALRAERAVWPLQLARAERWTGPMPGSRAHSFALAGDAAHTLHPLAGQGLNVGLADVAELVQVIRNKEFWRPLNDTRLLRRYERARQADVRAMGLVTDGLQRLFAQNGAVWPPLRNWGLTCFDRSGPLKRWVTRHAMGTDVPKH